MTAMLLLSAVAPNCDAETFFTQSRNFLTYATNQLRGFRSRDIQDFFAPAFPLLSAREPEKHPLIFKLMEELAKSSRPPMRTSAAVLIAAIIPTLEQTEVEKVVMSIVSKLASDLDEPLMREVVTCVGLISRHASSPELLRVAQEYFDDWLKRAVPVQLQVLKTFAGIIADVDSGFRDSFILPKLLECASHFEHWTDPATVEQAMAMTLQALAAIDTFSEETVTVYIVPIFRIVSAFGQCAEDPRTAELRTRLAGYLA
jgi:hypothetical protein